MDWKSLYAKLYGACMSAASDGLFEVTIPLQNRCKTADLLMLRKKASEDFVNVQFTASYDERDKCDPESILRDRYPTLCGASIEQAQKLLLDHVETETKKFEGVEVEVAQLDQEEQAVDAVLARPPSGGLFTFGILPEMEQKKSILERRNRLEKKDSERKSSLDKLRSWHQIRLAALDTDAEEDLKFRLNMKASVDCTCALKMSIVAKCTPTDDHKCLAFEWRTMATRAAELKKLNQQVYQARLNLAERLSSITETKQVSLLDVGYCQKAIDNIDHGSCDEFIQFAAENGWSIRGERTQQYWQHVKVCLVKNPRALEDLRARQKAQQERGAG